MNMAPDITKEWIQVTEADFNLFRDQYAPNHHRVAHCGGENYHHTPPGWRFRFITDGEMIAFRLMHGNRFFIHESFINDEQLKSRSSLPGSDER